MSFRNYKRRRERVLRKCAAMRAAKERKRLAQVREAREVGWVTFAGPMFGGEHVLRCLDAGEPRLWIEIDGQAHRA